MRNNGGFWRTFVLALMPALAALGRAGAQTVVYSSGFENGAGAEWSSTATDATPSGRKFLGQFPYKTVTLSLPSLPPHAYVTLSYEVYVIRSWDGNDTLNPAGGADGPDLWDVRLHNGLALVHATFANYRNYGHRQSYPDTYVPNNVIDHPVGTGAAELNTLGYTFTSDGPMDSVYRFSHTFSHAASTLAIDFSGKCDEGIDNESWGLDNVVVSVSATPPPATVAYSSNFAVGAGPEWSNTHTALTPTGRPFLGVLGNQAASLTLHGLPFHTRAGVDFDLFIINSWDGNGEGCCGPDTWSLMEDGQPLVNTTFSTTAFAGNFQAFPDAYPGGKNPAGTAAVETKTLGYPGNGDNVYHIHRDFPHAAGDITLAFAAHTNEGADDEGWGLANVVVRLGTAPGDVNDDGATNAADALAALRLLTGVDPADAAAAQRADIYPWFGKIGYTHGDGVLTTDDVKEILRLAAGLTP